jgi:putative addiction module killer protein
MHYEIETTNIFDKWLNSLKDKTAVTRIMSRLYRMEQGNFGDVKTVGQNLFEIRFFFSSGFRVYYTIRGKAIILLLCGGDKSTQKKDIEKAKKIME